MEAVNAENKRLQGVLLCGLVAALFLLSVSSGKILSNRAKAANPRSSAVAVSTAGQSNGAGMSEFATVALGGFRGVLADALWIRASRLQQQRRFVELMQLSDWIMALEPENEEMWAYHSWNLAYNVSFLAEPWGEAGSSDSASSARRGEDRWRWVKAGVELLRDRGIVLNPRSARLKHELAWLFYHKMGFSAVADDVAAHYRTEWARAIAPALGRDGMIPSPESCGSAEAATQATALLRESFKMDPVVMRAIEKRFGSFDWRVPAASAVYWAFQPLDDGYAGIQDANCRRDVYASLGDMVRGAGRLRGNPLNPEWDFDSNIGPNLDVVDGTVEFTEDASRRTSMPGPKIAASFLMRDIVLLAAASGREGEARKYYARLCAYLRSVGVSSPLPEYGEISGMNEDWLDNALLRAGIQ